MRIDVVVVDDDPDIRTTLGEVLREEGYSVVALEDAGALLETMEREEPALVLLDLTMPGADVARTVEELRQRGWLERTTVLALTGLDDAERASGQLGLHGTLRKPFDLDDLLKTAERVCRHPAEPPGAHP